MLRIEYFDKNRFMKQVAASRGSIILHLDNGTTCDLKKDREASAIFQTCLLYTSPSPRDCS